jgi:hypothetical protein
LIQPPAGPQGFLSGLEESALAELVGRSAWLYPVVEIVHVVGFVILVGCILVFDLRILGLLRRLPVEDAVAHLTRWARWSLVLVVPSGLVLFMVEATTLAGNPAFRWKLAFMALAAVNAALFHGVTWRRAEGGGIRRGAARPPFRSRPVWRPWPPCSSGFWFSRRGRSFRTRDFQGQRISGVGRALTIRSR